MFQMEYFYFLFDNIVFPSTSAQFFFSHIVFEKSNRAAYKLVTIDSIKGEPQYSAGAQRIKEPWRP